VAVDHFDSAQDGQLAADAELDAKMLKLMEGFDESMNDDFNTARVLANMFEIVPVINSVKDGLIKADAIAASTWKQMQKKFKSYIEDIFGLKDEMNFGDGKLSGVMELLIEIRKEAKTKKDFATSDKIRNQLGAIGINLKDEKGGEMSWGVE
jgi:cysteinyl-tRNA synthetase